jgi:hypothetical protein
MDWLVGDCHMCGWGDGDMWWTGEIGVLFVRGLFRLLGSEGA